MRCKKRVKLLDIAIAADILSFIGVFVGAYLNSAAIVIGCIFAMLIVMALLIILFD